MEEKLKDIHEEVHNNVSESIEANNIDAAIEKLDNYLRDLHKLSTIEYQRPTKNISNGIIEVVNQKFIDYRDEQK